MGVLLSSKCYIFYQQQTETFLRSKPVNNFNLKILMFINKNAKQRLRQSIFDWPFPFSFYAPPTKKPRPVQLIMKHFILPITSKRVHGFNFQMVKIYKRVILTCTYIFILLVRVVFRKTQTVEEGIEQGLLRHNQF